jgi:hypothetical protein
LLQLVFLLCKLSFRLMIDLKLLIIEFNSIVNAG